MKIATNIPTEIWNQITQSLLKEDWVVRTKYEGIDAGIDFDFFILQKGRERITFGWDNWEEGEIKCADKLMNWLIEKFEVTFQFGEPTNLTPKIIGLTKFQILYNRFKKKF